jgi:hypothetical protein
MSYLLANRNIRNLPFHIGGVFERLELTSPKPLGSMTHLCKLINFCSAAKMPDIERLVIQMKKWDTFNP